MPHRRERIGGTSPPQPLRDVIFIERRSSLID